MRVILFWTSIPHEVPPTHIGLIFERSRKPGD